MTTGIEWTDDTWNPTVGCTRASRGCDNCYAVRSTRRLAGSLPIYQGLVNPGRGHFNGTVRTIEARLDQPLRWRRPRRIFVDSMSDLFHPGVPFDFIDRVFAVMALASQHQFQILTKRPRRMREFFGHMPQGNGTRARVWRAAAAIARTRGDSGDVSVPWPLPNVWLGTSVEDQAAADERIPHLLETPAAVRFLSMEPLLEWVTLTTRHLWGRFDGDSENAGLHWVIVGGESGPGARPMHPIWAQEVRMACASARVPFFFKQWGAWAPRGLLSDPGSLPVDNANTMILNVHGNQRGKAAGSLTNQVGPFSDGSPCEVMERVGKKAAGRVLDGQTWDQYPEATT